MSSVIASQLRWFGKLRARLGTETWVALSLLFVMIGFWLRSRRFFTSTIAFWNDEANWAIQLLTKPVMAPSIRPVGFVAVSKLVANTFGPSEVPLRFLPWLASIGATVVAIPLAKRLFHTVAARLAFVAVIALHPMAINLAKEFKPYSISLLIHLCCLWLGLAYCDTGKRRFLAGAMAVPWVGVLFAQDVVFVLPALYLALGFAALRERRTRDLLLLALGVLLTLAVLAALYWFFWKYVSGPGGPGRRRVNGLSSAWWSPALDLFYPGKVTNETHWAWLGRKLVQIAAFGGERRGGWSPLGPISEPRLETLASMDTLLWTLLAVLGLSSLAIRRRWRNLLLLVLPVLVVLGFNAAKLWPLGAFRSDVFLLAYTPAWVASALDFRGAAEKPPPLWRAALPTVALVLCPLLLFERTWHRHKSGGGEFLEGAKALIDLQGKDFKGPRETLILDGYLCVVWRYYQSYHPGQRELFQELNRRFRKQCVRPWTQPVLSRANRTHAGRHRFWLLLARPEEMQQFRGGSPAGYQVLMTRDIEEGQTLAVALRRH